MINVAAIRMQQFGVQFYQASLTANDIDKLVRFEVLDYGEQAQPVRGGKKKTATMALEPRPDELELLRATLVDKPAPKFAVAAIGPHPAKLDLDQPFRKQARKPILLERAHDGRDAAPARGVDRGDRLLRGARSRCGEARRFIDK